MSELTYNEPAERFAPIVEKSLCAGASAVMIPSETGCWVHYAEYCERIANLKSEADQVIAEKDKQLRHANYKRCLDKAKWCKLWYEEEKYEWQTKDTHHWFMSLYEKWHRRWLELADKFKEAK